MQSRRDRTQAIVRDILRSRRGGECAKAVYQDEPWHDVNGGEEVEITFRMTQQSTRGPARRLAHWLFINGGMSVVLLVGLMAFGIIAAMLGVQ
jgi:hypothetical protein